jgi:signal peptidase II
MQAEGGASLTHGAAEPGRRPLRLFFGVAAGAYLLDLSTKLLAVARLEGEPPVPVIGDFLQLTLVRNPGAAFSTGTSYTPVITAVAIAAAVVVVWLVWRVRSTGWAWAFGLLLAGILGNLADRMFRSPGPFRGHVVDFIALPHWPVFNVADMCINVAAGLILLLALLGIRLDGSRERGHHRGRADVGDDGDDD